MGAIEKAVRDSDLGVNPTNDGQVLRVVFPQLTEERRRDLVKVARPKGEDAKVAIRNVRRQAKEELDRIAKDGEAGEDEVRRAEKELDDDHGQARPGVDDAVKNKESRAARGLTLDGRRPHESLLRPSARGPRTRAPNGCPHRHGPDRFAHR